ncbi:MAG: DUF4293 domain-containing protein [Candidatus Pedobacter colombiensis]|uniref:DUF4293 domain-containing protein n=1 Tax=Candidatus Pedobacter colombiensis TaxID=3121371 RepID=A0AAJ5WA70_9SPHI|nr:DUF4293 domain-containing protein [Pedobacter sp.]WEK19916.1 MAG: DUF4293 domain-containing protein [Pedobacter sp.]
MIQRVQSIWLLLASFTLICLFFIPLITKSVNNTEYLLYIDGHQPLIKGASAESIVVTPIGAMIINGIAVLLCLTCIFQFKNRVMQKRLIMINMVLIITTAILSALNASLLPGGIAGSSLHIGSSLFILALLFCMLAIRGIRKDEQLLRSADRLR